MKPRAIVIAAGLLVLGGCSNPPGLGMSTEGSLPDVSLDEMIARSTAIVRGDVVGDQRSRWNSKGTHILTDQEFRVVDWLKGTGRNHVVIRRLGGRVGKHSESVVGSASLSPGKDLILFLTLEKGTDLDLNGEYYVSFGALGIYSVEGTVARNSIADRSLSELLSRIRTQGASEL